MTQRQHLIYPSLCTETPSSSWLVGGAPDRIFCCSLFAAKFGGLELHRLVASIVRLICGRPLRLSAGDSVL